MATTVPGGRYRRVDGIIVDANGNTIETPKTPSEAREAAKVDTDLTAYTVAELKQLAEDRGVDLTGASRKDAIVAALEAAEKGE